jgi:CYTH domain-containing protein
MPKYAQLEIERRMRIPPDLVPDLSGQRYTEIEDRYLDAGRLRLRKMTDYDGAESIYKLCKKYGSTGTYEEPIVNIYLTQEEYNALHVLPGNDLIKRRYRYAFQGRQFSIDAHTGSLAGLYLCECEADSVSDLMEIAFPPFAVQDVTEDPRFSGVQLAHAARLTTSHEGLDHAGTRCAFE